MLKLLFSLLAISNCTVYASGCDPYYFYHGNKIEEHIIYEINNPSSNAIDLQIEIINSAHANSLRPSSIKLNVENTSKMQLTSSVYTNLDTDCGWSEHGLTLKIIHLKITSLQNGKEVIYYYPDVYKDILPESVALSEFITIYK